MTGMFKKISSPSKSLSIISCGFERSLYKEPLKSPHMIILCVLEYCWIMLWITSRFSWYDSLDAGNHNVGRYTLTTQRRGSFVVISTACILSLPSSSFLTQFVQAFSHIIAIPPLPLGIWKFEMFPFKSLQRINPSCLGILFLSTDFSNVHNQDTWRHIIESFFARFISVDMLPFTSSTLKDVMFKVLLNDTVPVPSVLDLEVPFEGSGCVKRTDNRFLYSLS